MHRSLRLFLTTMIPLAVAAIAPAVQTEVFLDDSVEDFAQGDFTTGTLTFRGTILPPLKRTHIAEIDAPVIWDIAEIDGTRYAATGHEARLFRQSGDAAPELAHDFEETAIFSLLAAEDGALLVGASPGGKVYRLAGDEEPTLHADTGAQIVWDMVRHESDVLVATGSPATIVRVADDGTTATLATFEFALNVLDIAVHAGNGDVIAATQGPGRIARVSADGTVSILIDPEQEEVRRVAVLPDGSVIGAVNGERSPGEKLLERVTDGARRQGNQKPRPESFIVRIHPDGMAREWWTAPESPIHDVYTREDGSVIVAAGARGNLFLIEANGETTHLGLAKQRHVTRLAPAADGRLLAATALDGALYEIDSNTHGDGLFDSRVFDAKGTVNWGRLRGTVATGDGALRISTRSGNTKEPDDTWNPWTEPQDFNQGEAIVRSPVSRFLQYRVHFTVSGAPRAVPPEVDLIRVFHTRPNEAPRVRAVQVAPPRDARPTPPPAAIPPTGRVFGLPFTNPEVLEVTWTQEDPNGDPLIAALYLRATGDADWTLVKDQLLEAKFPLMTRGLPDGEYRARVVVNDVLFNLAEQSLQAEATSPLFLIDNTAPAIVVLAVLRESDEEVSVRFRAEDAASLVSGAAWRAGFGDWQLLVPEDGALDQKSETFTLKITGEAAKRGAFVTVIAVDEKGNAVLEKITLE